MSLVRCKVLPQQGICTMGILKTFLIVPISLRISNSTWYMVYIVNADFQVLPEFKVPVT